MNEAVAPVGEQAFIDSQVEKRVKSLPTAYRLCIAAGYFGAHRFYLGDKKNAWKMLALTLVGLQLIIFLIGIPMLIAVIVWVLRDAVIMPRLYEEHKASVREQVMAEMELSRGQTVPSRKPE